MASPGSNCQALNLSDSQFCTQPATSSNGLFCQLHDKQARGLYKGYKRRNAVLDGLQDKAPSYLKKAETPLANDTFQSVKDEVALREVHAHLLKEYALLGQVIEARRLHHKCFYPLSMDYGHQAYLDQLANRRHVALRALERLEKRTAEILYEKEKWYRWVREVQLEEETHREKEQKKVKAEAAMFKRHWKKMQTRLRAQREKEEKHREDVFLDAAFEERQRASAETDEDEEMWDPIEDFMEDGRSQYTDLIRHFLWMELLPDEDIPMTAEGGKPVDAPEDVDSNPKKAKKKAKSKNGTNKTPSGNDSGTQRASGQEKIMEMMDQDSEEAAGERSDPNKANIETEAEMRKRLATGVVKNYDSVRGALVVGTMESPVELHARVPPMPADEVDDAVREVKEIKLLLFCRLLLSYASLLPAAVNANSVDDFLDNPDIPESELRDLCLKVEQPSLQDIRDACADLTRGEELDDDDETEDPEEEESLEKMLWHDHRFGHLESRDVILKNLTTRAKIMGILDVEDDEASAHGRKNKPKPKQKMKIRVCGKSIWNYSSEKSMSRSGWLQFSIMAKDCDLRQAIQLCRNWDEFSDVNLLTIWQFFPASNWVSWGNDRLTQQLHQFGFFPYFQDFTAASTTKYHEVGGRSRHQRRQHDIVEKRNIIVGHMKRNDPVTQRFLHYCSMRTGEILLLVRDGKTGKVLTCPEKEQLFTYRVKQGLGRSSRNEYENILEVGPEYFEVADRLRRWRFGFEDYYDVWIWDFVPGRKAIDLYDVLIMELRNAWRIRQPADVYKHMKPLLSGLTREEETMRVRLIKPNEKSIWDDVTHPDKTFFHIDLRKGPGMIPSTEEDLERTPHLYYSAASAAEDAVLFSGQETAKNWLFEEIDNPIESMHTAPPAWLSYLGSRMRDYKKPSSTQRAVRDSMDLDSDESGESDQGDESEKKPVTISNLWALPSIWEEAIRLLDVGTLSSDRAQLLRNVGIISERTGGFISAPQGTIAIQRRFKRSDQQEIMERDRCIAFKQGFHACDFEPGAQEKYAESCELHSSIQKYCDPTKSIDWFWACASLLEWLGVRADYDIYNQDPLSPWPHSFIIQDVVATFAAVAPFFQELEVSSPATSFLKSTDGKKRFGDSLLFKPLERSQILPDYRSRVSFKYRPKSFWKDWEAVLDSPSYFTDVYPMDWSIAIRPIIAKLYLSGIIAPSYRENSMRINPGIATANTEPHRPDKLDLFIEYADRADVMQPLGPPPGIKFVQPSDWPALLPLAQKYAADHGAARFAVLRIWSAPHFYPLMIGLSNRKIGAFLDPAGRAWEWRFIPKDSPISEWSIYHSIWRRLDVLRSQLGDHVDQRGDVLLIKGASQEDLMKYCLAVTFALQTKPWFREIDWWKSFVNVDLDFLQGLDAWWLD